MTHRLIPNGDLDFRDKSLTVARVLAKDPARFGMNDEECAAMTAAADRFARAVIASRGAARSPSTTRAKDEARAECERLYRKCVARVRINEDLDACALMSLGLRPPKEKRQPRAVPHEPPRLRFLRALHEGRGATPMHELEFRAFSFASAKPAGAARLELFADLIPPDEPIPAHPGANWGGRPWYLRSYTRSPIRLIPPMPRVPMRVVYWGRWADATGNVGPFSATATAWIEGGSHGGLPGAPANYLDRARQVPILDVATDSSPGAAPREHTLVVAVLEAQYESFAPSMPAAETRMLPEPRRELRQLEGPCEPPEHDRDAA